MATMRRHSFQMQISKKELVRVAATNVTPPSIEPSATYSLATLQKENLLPTWPNLKKETQVTVLESNNRTHLLKIISS
jgi:hypothetical protein